MTKTNKKTITLFGEEYISWNNLLEGFKTISGGVADTLKYQILSLDENDLKKLKKKLKQETDVRCISGSLFDQIITPQSTMSHIDIKSMVNIENRFQYTKKDISNYNFFEKYLNTDEIESALTFYKKFYTDLIEKNPLPNMTHNLKKSHYITLSNKFSDSNKKGLYLISGLHAREWHPPDALIYFIKILCFAFKNDEDIKIGLNVFKIDQIKKIVNNLNIYIFPLVNPDGREFSQQSKNCADLKWRKNRRRFSNNIFGVDLNRNFDFLWDYKNYLCKKTANLSHMSINKNNDNFVGCKAFSEPETRNVRYVLKKYNNIEYFLDIHSYNHNINNILYTWSHSKTQTKRDDVNMKKSKYWGNHGSDFLYSEYTECTDLELRKEIATEMALAANKASYYKRKYIPKPSIDMYLMTGGSRDYMENRNIMNTKKYPNKIHSFFMEASSDDFFPTVNNRKLIIKEIISSIIQLCIKISNK